MMTAPPELQVISGGTKSVHLLKPGIQHLRIPSSPAPAFAVCHHGKAILSKDGEPIANRIERYDYFPTSGFVYAQ